MVAGTQIAHLLAYRLVYPDARVRLRDLLATGHGYLVGSPEWLPLVLGVLGGVEIVAIGWRVAAIVRGRPGAPVAPWVFALLPLAGFTVQEFLERSLAGSSLPWWFVLQPTYRVGLLLQLPVALVVYVLARLLLHVAERVARAISASPRRLLVGSMPPSWRVVESETARAPLRSGSSLGRGPPARALRTALA
jgi:alkylated DNA nucleotide flippase Atl1